MTMSKNGNIFFVPSPSLHNWLYTDIGLNSNTVVVQFRPPYELTKSGIDSE